MLKFGLRYVWRQRWQCLLLTLGFGVVTGFGGTYALYSDQLTDASKQHIVSTLTKEQTNLALYNSGAFAPETSPIIENALGDLFSQSIRFSRAIGSDGMPTLGKICSYHYVQGEPLTTNSRLAYTTADHCYIAYSFAPLEDVFSLTDGRWPQVLDPPAAALAPDTPRIMDKVQIETLISTANAEQTGLQVGDRLMLGNRFDQTATVEIVGLVDPVIAPDNVFWHGNLVTLTGEWTPYGDDMRLDIGLIMHENAFAEWMPAITPTYFYAWWYEIDPHTITATQLDTLDDALYRAERDIRAMHPDIRVTGGLELITQDFEKEIAQYEATVHTGTATIEAVLIGLLTMLAGLLFTAEQKTWRLLIMRGAKRFQLMLIMLLEVLIAGVIGTGGGMLGAWGLVALFSPAELPAASGVGINTLLMGLYGAGAAWLVLALAAWWISRRMLRPTVPSLYERPAQPLWIRYYLDVALLVVGLIVFVRLIHLATDDVGTGVRDFVLDPVSLTRRLAGTQHARGVGLSDPFNLAGPLLILCGMALIWLRVFPIVLRLPVWALGQRRSLLAPLALWQTVRAPGRYTMLALPLVIVSALVTASATLEATVNAAARRTAYHEVGADVRLTVDPAAAPVDGLALPGVTAAAPVIRLDETARNIALLGVEPATLQADLGVAFSQLTLPVEALPGLLLPDDAVSLTAETLDEPNPGDAGNISFEAVLADAHGMITRVPMSEQAHTTADRETIAVDLPGDPPWHLLGFRISSTYQKPHIIYLDDVAVRDADGQITLLEDFESDLADHWTAGLDRPSALLLPEHNLAAVMDGQGSLKMEVLVKFDRFADLRPVLMATGTQLTEVPVVVSRAYVDQEQRRMRSAPRLKVGDHGVVSLKLAHEPFLLAYHIVGIVEDFPTLDPDAVFIVAPLNALRYLLNTGIPVSVNYDVNQVWLYGQVAGNEQELAALPGVTGVAVADEQYHALRQWPMLVAVPGLLRLGSAAAVVISTLLLIVYAGREFSRYARHVTALHVLGWSKNRACGVLIGQLAALVVTAIIAGMGLGVLLIYLLLPFLAGLGNEVLRLPIIG